MAKGSLKRKGPSRKRRKEPSARRLATAPPRDRRRVGHNAGWVTAEIVGADAAAPYPSLVGTRCAASDLPTPQAEIPRITGPSSLSHAQIRPTQALVLPTRALVLPTRAFVLLTHAFVLPTQALALPTRAIVLPTHAPVLPT